jgi:hypothetical protein
MDIKDSMINNEVWDALPHSGIPKKPVSRLYSMIGVVGNKKG